MKQKLFFQHQENENKEEDNIYKKDGKNISEMEEWFKGSDSSSPFPKDNHRNMNEGDVLESLQSLAKENEICIFWKGISDEARQLYSDYLIFDTEEDVQLLVQERKFFNWFQGSESRTDKKEYLKTAVESVIEVAKEYYREGEKENAVKALKLTYNYISDSSKEGSEEKYNNFASAMRGSTNKKGVALGMAMMALGVAVASVCTGGLALAGAGALAAVGSGVFYKSTPYAGTNLSKALDAVSSEKKPGIDNVNPVSNFTAP